MLYRSTNGKAKPVNFKTALINGQAEDKGLYFPEKIPVLPDSFIKNLKAYSREEIAFKVIQPYVQHEISDAGLQEIIKETVNFDFPLITLNEHIAVLELFHGPTMAFKDVGARFMSRCLAYLTKSENKKVTVLVATSGDTGGAVADGFYNVENVNVVVLYPSGKVSEVQEKQLTTYGNNIKALEVKGNFDDCQKMVKEAFADNELRKQLHLTSANSINVARWLPQQFYYFFALQQWQQEELPVISVPSGNFGNICAGMLAWKSGLPVKHFIASCNTNDTVTEWFHTGEYQPKKAVATISNAMDVGDPSNFVRILEIFSGNTAALKTMLSSYSFSDEATRIAMQDINDKYGYLSEPHGAIGYLGLQSFLNAHPGNKGLFLETAHPVKFPDAVPYSVEIPERIKLLMQKTKKAVTIEPEYEALKGFLLSGGK